MRFYLTLLLFAVKSVLWGQFSDDFGDGDFTISPAWSGQTTNFIVNASNELQLNAPAVMDTSYLSLATSNIDNTTWNFYLRMEFNPSSSNFCRVYLVSDSDNLKGSLTGYFVMLGGTADEVSLYRQDGTSITKIIDGVDGTLSSDPAISRVQVTRDNLGNWQLFQDNSGGFAYVSEGSVADATYTSTTNFGVFCRYTSTRSTSFFFDNLGDPYADINLPILDTAIAISETELDVQFSEPMDQLTTEVTANYYVNNGIGTPTTAIQDGGDAGLIHLTFATPFVNTTLYTLTLSSVEDIGNNPVAPNSTANFVYFVSDIPLPNDVIITEFMADPLPAVWLPEAEYVEIFNRTTKFFNLNGWTLSDGSSTGTFSTHMLGPGEYVLICNTGDCAQFFVSNNTELSLPSLNNSSDAIVIKDDMGTVIDSIYYTTAWYNDATKEDGGWSLERRHLNAPCNDQTNWNACVDPTGGTPGLVNSVVTSLDDTSAPAISSFVVNSSTNLTINFNEILDTNVAALVSISPGVSTLNWNFASLQTLNVDIQTLLVNQLYTIIISNVSDCWGNNMTGQSIHLGIPDSIQKSDLILNEIMFNPLTNGSDYVELYNHSDKILDLHEAYLANWDDSIANYKSISNVQYLLLPEQYALITEDTNDIIKDFGIYGLETFIEADIPTYPNDSGTVYLVSKDLIVLDYFHYDEDFHFDLLSSEDGKSLERISFDGETNNPDNWHTAAEVVEWGTPGYKNSQLFIPNPSGSVSVDPKLFSPDSDGYQDVLTINLDLQSTENVVDIEIFDNRGRLIRLLKDNYFVGSQATVTWDGINTDGEKADIGSYILLVSVIDEQRNQTQYKLVVVLAGNL